VRVVQTLRYLVSARHISCSLEYGLFLL